MAELEPTELERADAERIRLVGGTASPYTQKMLALLRYRRLPYSVTWGQPAEYCQARGITPPSPALMPTFLFQSDEGTVKAVCDSTPIIRQLEREHTARAVIPTDPALAFIDYLIEDFADEWCTKYMFHYRWHPPADADNAGTLLPLGFDVSMPEAQLTQFKSYFTQRQIDRLWVVGSSPETANTIESSYQRFLQALEAHLAQLPFMLGHRPGAGDFALYGQLSQLVGFDPTPRAMAHELSPRTVAWVDHLADQSGCEPQASDWFTLEALPDSIRHLLAEVGRVYAPAQLANAQAHARGERQWTCDIDGAPWTQRTFPYQVKCLRWTQEQFQQLSAGDQQRVLTLTADTGIEAMLRA
jgi:glutathione S-transferase